MSEIVVVCPVLGRPQNAQPLVDSLAASEADARLLFVCSPEDESELAAVRATGADYLVVDWPAGRADFARKVNAAYRQTTEPYIFQAADDVEFEPGWDREALRAINSGPYGVCGTQDDANPQVRRGLHSTHSLFRRSYCDQPGASGDGPRTVFSEAYDHQWVDSEAVAIAQARGAWVFAHLAVVRHLHPLWQTAPMDATYAKGLARGNEDGAIFHSRRRLWEQTG